MINLELPKDLQDLTGLMRQFSEGGLRPISRKYDTLEQKELPEELVELGALLKAGRSSSSKKEGHAHHRSW